MKARILGTAAGGGFPQWNCACALCVRAGKPGVPSRTQDCVAVSGDGRSWWLLNASPDVRAQILATPELTAGPGPRETPVRGVLLTDAELDHTVGLVSLREGAGLRVHGTSPVLAAVRAGVGGVLTRYNGVRWELVEPDVEFPLDGGLLVTALSVGHKRPKYARESTVEGSWVVAYRVVDPGTGGVLVYAPCLAEWPSTFDEVLSRADCVILDGTFFDAEEMSGATGARVDSRAQHAMGHLPVGGPDGSLRRLRGLTRPRCVYTHLNNTNPLVDAFSPQRAELAAAGVEVADDGAELEL
ncbi:pyrroloquinoline quinone biosynthesis protein B [Streptoalloteichus tenebrarius]|uniref:Coenzyme PQQ synthesis protein B n=1 Tax=Streptoalloteichus tenebrarius (strain ATCC 17920 / DSM 40477 / JCM 4838 / CBS 697.72 / NBRC 16177 / NCIMB 11028 / NRRL B-12390 / A12253. 1 / ISP 5477) TaxID=1933 RepID=A0ABT1HTX4_STRSD|nr:pyrroloquinoline quinone biosynthesis protein PqqB [Streptoalloteichus tenebrarius]MCP2258970.1 pyrroloquinoline quinone biosynthesis protein B [Streptoalloteichus tenebrarius]BFF01179.1 pyrroloquinoline quinone biosynthesis protein PqqB [Streptoalloteichus tenebrarius]